MSKSILSGRKLKMLLHILVWMVMFILPAYLIYGDSPRDKAFLTEVWFQIGFYGIVFYASYLWLAPRFFFLKRKALFFLITAILIIAATFLMGMVNNYLDPVFHNHAQFPQERPPSTIQEIPPGMPPPPFPSKPPPPIKGWPLFNFMLTASLISGLSLGFRFSEKLALNEKLRKETEKEKLNTELAFLKHQINPHFLFNTLNSIYSLALIKSDMTAEAVMKLSEMMRYVLQDVEKEKVPLALEVEYLEHFVELQKIRLSENVEVRFTIKGDPDAYEIPPIILVPFVENAFKFGTSAHENARITIEIRIAENQLAFQVFNQVFNGRRQAETFGIGIQNTRKRLQLIYPGKHQLELTKTESDFTVNLKIDMT